MTLHKQVLASGGVEVARVTGAALGTGVQDQHDSRMDLDPGARMVLPTRPSG